MQDETVSSYRSDTELELAILCFLACVGPVFSAEHAASELMSLNPLWKNEFECERDLDSA